MSRHNAKHLLLIATFVLAGLCVKAQNQEEQHIKRAILNYVEAFYEADTTKAYESVARDLAKRGYYSTKEGGIREAKMSFEQLVALSKRWKDNKDLAAAPKKITVFDVLDKIAMAKVEAQWGIDYFHLAKLNGKWTIINVLWQDYPPKN